MENLLSDEQEVEAVTLPSGREVKLRRLSREFFGKWAAEMFKETMVTPEFNDFMLAADLPLSDAAFIIAWAFGRIAPCLSPEVAERLSPRFKM